MASYDIIGGIVDPKALAELQNLEKLANNIAIKLKGVTLGSMSKEADAALVQRLNAETAKLVAQEEKLRVVIDKTTQGKKASNNATKEQIGYINQLEAEVKGLTLAFNSLSKAELDGSKGQQVLNNLKEKRAELSALRAAYGDMRLNVGNYSSATKMLGINIGQVMKEMPNFAISARIGIMSLTNNLPMLAETIKQVRVEQLALIAAGKTAPSMFSLIAKSVFGLTGVMSILMVLMQLFGGRIIEWVGELFKGEKAIKSISSAALGMKNAFAVMREALANSEMQKGIESINKLSANLQNAKGNAKESKYYVDEFNKTLGVTFGKAKNVDEALGLIDKNKDAYIQAMEKMTFANVLFAKSAEYMTKIVEVGMKPQSQVIRETGKNYKEMYENIQEYDRKIKEAEKTGFYESTYGTSTAGGGTTGIVVKISLEKLKILRQTEAKKITAIEQEERNRQVGIYTKGMNSMADEAKKAAKEMSDIWDANNWGYPVDDDKAGKDKVDKRKDLNDLLVNLDAEMFTEMRKNFDEHIKDMLKQVDDNQKFIEAYKKLTRGLEESMISGWVDSEGKELDDWLEGFKKQKAKEDKITEDSNRSIADSTEQIVSDLMDIWAVYYDYLNKKIDENLDKQKSVNDEKVKQFEDETDAGMHSQKELSEYKDRIADYQKSQDEEALRQKEENDKKAFMLNQVKTISDIWIAYALNMVKGGLNPLAQGLLLAQAISGTALVAAQTIPYFAEGGIMEKHGMAILGDANKHELAISPSGQYFISDNKPTMYNLEKGTQILPDANRIDLASILALRQVMPEIMENTDLLNELKKVTKAVSQQKHGNFYGMPLIKQIENRNKFSSRSRSLMN